MNQIIIAIAERGLSEQARLLCIVGGSVCLLTCAFWYGTRMGLSKKNVLLVLLIAYPCLLGAMELIFAVSKFMMRNHILGIQTASMSGVKICVFLPLMSRIIAKTLKLPQNLTADLLAVIRLIEYPLSTVGCIFTGCCTGYPWKWGLYNPTTGSCDFPVQPLNALIMCLIAAGLLIRAKKRNYVPDGKQLPLMLLWMGATRLLTEFLMDGEKVCLGLSVVALYCLAMCIIGAVMLVEKPASAKFKDAT